MLCHFTVKSLWVKSVMSSSLNLTCNKLLLIFYFFQFKRYVLKSCHKPQSFIHSRCAARCREVCQSMTHSRPRYGICVIQTYPTKGCGSYCFLSVCNATARTHCHGKFRQVISSKHPLFQPELFNRELTRNRVYQKLFSTLDNSIKDRFGYQLGIQILHSQF